jgi:hypothetical protein
MGFSYFGEILCCSQSDDDLQEDLVKFDVKLNMKVKFLKHPSIFLATCLNTV